jgi:hypothetical protein
MAASALADVLSCHGVRLDILLERDSDCHRFHHRRVNEMGHHFRLHCSANDRKVRVPADDAMHFIRDPCQRNNHGDPGQLVPVAAQDRIMNGGGSVQRPYALIIHSRSFPSFGLFDSAPTMHAMFN